jgi:hypothetical protein
MGNLVFTGKDTFLAIDHSNALHGPAWENVHLCSTQHMVESKPILLLELANGGAVPDRVKGMLVAAAEVIQETYYAKQDELRARLGVQSSADAGRAMDMTWWRCGELSNWTRQRLKVI